jgi:hypothetical protein
MLLASSLRFVSSRFCISVSALSLFLWVSNPTYMHTEHPNIRAFALHPGLVPTDVMLEAFAAMTIDPPELSGGLSLYLSTPRADFLRGKYVTVNWDVKRWKHALKRSMKRGC